MLIATLQKIVTPFGDVAYCATDPFDNEMLTTWHSTIMQVDHELEEKDKHWGIMLACHRGESDVPDRLSEESDTGPTNEIRAFNRDSIPYC